MAKPTGAKEYADYGLDVTNADSSTKVHLYHAFPAWLCPPGLSSGGGTVPMQPALRICVDVGTDTTLHAVIEYGTSQSATFVEDDGASGWTDEVECPPPFPRAFMAAGPDIGRYLPWVMCHVIVWCSSDGTGPNTTEIQGMHLTQQISGSRSDVFGYTRSPHQTEADRLYSPHNFFSAYHVRKLLCSSLSAIMSRIGAHVSIPMLGVYT